MYDIYRNDDYRPYASEDSKFYRHITYGRVNNYKNAYYGSHALAFYFPGFELGMGCTFHESPQDVVNKLNKDIDDKRYIRGHIINSYLDGSLHKGNLVPLTYAANSRHDTVEERIKDIVSRMNSNAMRATDVVLGYEVTVIVSRDGVPAGIDISLDFFYLSDRTGELYTSNSKREAASYRLLDPLWNWRFPLHIRILN